MDAVPLNRRSLRHSDLFVLLILLLAGIKYTFGLSHALDIGLYDESSYLHAGAALRSLGLPTAASAPLYAIWYYALSLVQPDLVRLYYLNYALTTILPPLFLYVLLRVNRMPAVAGAAIAGYFLITQANFVTWPRPSHFALLIVLASLAVAVSVRRASTGVLLLAAGALLAAFVRPEYFLAFLLLLAVGTALLVAAQRRELSPSPRAWIPLGAVMLTAVVLLGVFGLPAFGKGGSERHFFAFAQHYALNWAHWKHVNPNDPYNPATNFREIAAQAFGNAHTVSEAVHNNPRAFAHVVFSNAHSALSRFPGLFLHHEDIFLPPGKEFENLEARLTLLALATWIFLRWKTWWPVLGVNVRQHRRLLVCTVLVSVPGAISIIEIYPHDHYMLLPGTLLIVTAAVLFRGREDAWDTPPGLPLRHTLLLAVGLLAVTPTLSRGPAIDTPVVRTIRCIQSLGIQVPVRLLEAEGGYDLYQTGNYQRVAEYDKHRPFDQFLPTAGINMIVWTDWLGRDSRFVDDPTWHTFLDHYQDAGFEARPVPDSRVTLLVHRQILMPANRAGP